MHRLRRMLDPRDRYAGWIAPHLALIALIVKITLVLSVLWAIHHYAAGGYKRGPLPPTVRLSGGALPPSWSLTRYIVRIHYQGSGNSCVGQTGATIAEITAKEHGNAVPLSSGYLYNQIDGGSDKGASYDAMFGVLISQGDAPLSLFPPDGLGDIWTQPGPAARAAAYPFRLLSWRTILPGDRETMEAELHAGRPFAVAVPVTDSLYNNWSESTIPTVWSQFGRYHFNHSMTAVGYDQTGVIIVNSWGPTFGYHGLARLSWGFLQAVGASIVVAQPQSYAAPRTHRHRFPARLWNEYRRAHHESVIPYRDAHHHLTWPASVWVHHTWLRGIKAPGTWRAGHPGHMTYSFRAGTIYAWPKTHRSKVVHT